MTNKGVLRGYQEYDDTTLTECIKKMAEFELGETAYSKQEGLRKLRSKLEEFHPRLSDEFLLPFLRVCKYSVPKACQRVRHFYRQLKKLRDFLKSTDIAAISVPKDDSYMFDLPYRMKDGSALLVNKFGKHDFRRLPYEHIFLLELVSAGRTLMNPVNQVSGIRTIMDLEGFSFRSLLNYTPARMKMHIDVYQNAFPLRMKAIYIVNAPPVFSTLYNFCKPMLSKKLSERVHVFALGDWKSFHKEVPPEILPECYGGNLADSCLFDPLERIIIPLLRSGFFAEENRQEVTETFSEVILELMRVITAR